MISRLIERSESIGDGLWHWSVLLPPDEALERVQEVVYTLHPTFSRPVRRVRSRETAFAIEDVTSSSFTVYARVIFADGSEQLLEKRLELAPEAAVVVEAERSKLRPVIIAVDDDPGVSRAVERDLRARYSPAYRIKKFEDGRAGLEYLRGEATGDAEVAVVLADLRMPIVNGVDFLVEAARLHPRARRALLTAYADAEDAIRALNAGVNRYILKPWDPPEAKLYPTVDDLLMEWSAARSEALVSETLRTRII